MSNKQKHLTAVMLTLVVALSAGGIAVSAHQPESETQMADVKAADTQEPQTQTLPTLTPQEPFSCEIQASTANGRTTLTGILHSDVAFDGSYRFKVAGSGRSGNSSVQQGGYFSAGADEPVTLGRVMLGGAGTVYNASLEISANGASLVCEKRIGDTA